MMIRRKPEQQLFIMACLEDSMRLVVQAEGFVLGHHFHYLFSHVQTKWLWKRGPGKKD